MSNITFKMKRNGSFRANWLNRQNVCGVNVSLTPTYTFSCDLETNNRLDSRGFILDNLLVQEYFNRTYANPMVPRSCENIAWDAVQELLSMLRDNGQTPLRVAVTIGEFGGNATLTCEWTSGHREENEMPRPLGVTSKLKDNSRKKYREAADFAAGKKVGRVRNYDQMVCPCCANPQGKQSVKKIQKETK